MLVAAPKRVVVMDSDSSVRALVAEALEAKGYAVDAAADGETASRLLGKGTSAPGQVPDLFVGDVMMTGADGTTLARFVQGRAELRAMPIIFVSGRSSAETVVSAMHLGVRHYVAKPFSLRDLMVKVDRLLR